MLIKNIKKTEKSNYNSNNYKNKLEKMDINRKTIYSLFKELNLAKNIIKHVELVSSISEKIAIEFTKQEIKVDIDLVIYGALLHDIGRSKTHTIKHAIEGAIILKNRNYDKKIVRIVENHIGGGINMVEAKDLGLPIKDYTPKTLEEKIVSAADNLTLGDKRITLEKRVQYFNSKGLKKGAEKIELLHKELSNLINLDLDEI